MKETRHTSGYWWVAILCFIVSNLYSFSAMHPDPGASGLPEAGLAIAYAILFHACVMKTG